MTTRSPAALSIAFPWIMGDSLSWQTLRLIKSVPGREATCRRKVCPVFGGASPELLWTQHRRQTGGRNNRGWERVGVSQPWCQTGLRAGGGDVKCSRLVHLKPVPVHDESAELTVRNSRAVGPGLKRQTLSGPGRWQMPLLRGEVQGAEQAARPFQSCVLWCGPDGHPPSQFLTQQDSFPVSSFH